MSLISGDATDFNYFTNQMLQLIHTSINVDMIGENFPLPYIDSCSPPHISGDCGSPNHDSMLFSSSTAKAISNSSFKATSSATAIGDSSSTEANICNTNNNNYNEVRGTSPYNELSLSNFSIDIDDEPDLFVLHDVSLNSAAIENALQTLDFDNNNISRAALSNRIFLPEDGDNNRMKNDYFDLNTTSIDGDCAAIDLNLNHDSSLLDMFGDWQSRSNREDGKLEMAMESLKSEPMESTSVMIKNDKTCENNFGKYFSHFSPQIDFPSKCIGANCNSQFQTRSDLDNHLLNVYRMRRAPPSISSSSLPSLSPKSRSSIIEVDTNCSKWTCDDCSKCCKSQQSLYHHHYMYHKKGEYRCTQFGCQFVARFRGELRQHIYYTHRDGKKFICAATGCERTFATKSALVQHRRSQHERSTTTKQDGGHRYFVCNRSGCTYSTKQPRRWITHINGHCQKDDHQIATDIIDISN